MDKKDSKLDQEIIENLKEIAPPENEISDINPWKIPINSITWGLILTTIHLNFLYLQYILPTIGVILVFIGFRSLRNENKYFRTIYFAAIVKLVIHLLNIIRVATPLNILNYPELAIGCVLTSFQIFIFLTFHKALKEVYINAGKTMDSSPLIGATLWTVFAFLLAISPLAETWLAFITMIIFYVLIIKSIFSIGEQLDDTGYLLTYAPVKISDKRFGRIYFALIMVIGISFNISSNHLKLESKEFSYPNNTQLRESFIDMGFPEDVLRYLENSDLELLKDLVDVQVGNELLMFDPKEIEHVEGTENRRMISYTYEPRNKNIDARTIFIEMPEKTLYVMQYFKWIGGNPIWQDGIMITGNHEIENRAIISSGLFYSKNGGEYMADFPYLDMESVERHTFFGTHWAEPIRGTFSFPIGSQNQGGYVLYRYGTMLDDRYLIASLFEYLHQSNPIRIPYTRTEDLILNGSYSLNNNYKQHYTTYESIRSRQITNK